MSPRRRASLTPHAAAAAAALTAVAVAALAGPPATAKQRHARVKAPRHGQYIGETRQDREITLYVSKRRVRQAVVEFKCGFASGRVTVRRLKLHRTRRGYTFAVHGRRPFSYSDRHPAERGRLDLTGRFSRTGTKARGRVRAKSRHCGGTGRVRWSVRHVNKPVKTPKSGQYSGTTAEQRGITLYTSGRSIDLAAIEFKCTDDVDGATNLNSVPLKRTRKGYAFSIKAHSNVSYSDGQPDENAEVDLIGRFARTGKTAAGHIRVKSPRCGGTGQVAFSVKRRSSG